MTDTAQSLRAFIDALPKTETHLHMEGALPWRLLQELDGIKYAATPPSWEGHFKFRDFAHFDKQLLGHATAWYVSPERYHRAAVEVFKELRAQNVRYIETSFASGVVEFFCVDAKGILDGILAAAPEGLEVRVFMGIHHGGMNAKMLPIIEEALTWDGLAGIDLHGTETIPVDEGAPRIWREAREAGKFTKAHAGEFCGADFVKYVIEALGAQRIEHGVRAIEDPAVIELIRERDLTLDICPISNVKLMPDVTRENHPIRELFDAGVRCTVSTDDPLVFGNTLADEYELLHEYRGFTRAELAQVARNGFEAALVCEEHRQALLAEFDRAVADLKEPSTDA
ncbi:MAG: adenosine deaminase family protein [Puniceicoccales bacterium]